MMKNWLKKLVLLSVMSVLLVASLAACNKKEEVKDQAINQANDQEKDSALYTITFMNGDTSLGTTTVKENAALTKDAYTSFENVADTEFLGWFETPTFLESSKKDLTTATFTKDTTLFGSFKSTKVAQDERSWYIVGTSEKGILKVSNWAGSDVKSEDQALVSLLPTGNATNEFAITIDLFAGDQFQIIHDWAWDGQKGFGCFTTIDPAQMENGGGLGGSANTANVNVIMDGNYTITLTTDPDNSIQDTLAIIRNGDAQTTPIVIEEAPYAVSENTNIMVKGSWVADWSEIKPLSRTEGTNVFTITMDLVADTELCFMVYDGEEDTGIVLKEGNVKEDASLALLAPTGNNIKVSVDGSYTFTVDAAAQTVIVSK